MNQLKFGKPFWQSEESVLNNFTNSRREEIVYTVNFRNFSKYVLILITTDSYKVGVFLRIVKPLHTRKFSNWFLHVKILPTR